LSERETADALGCPVGTVKSRLARALDSLRASIDLGAVEVADG
jgi:DNA-directed RNA polymerase specialized sigma24 family protein